MLKQWPYQTPLNFTPQTQWMAMKTLGKKVPRMKFALRKNYPGCQQNELARAKGKGGLLEIQQIPWKPDLHTSREEKEEIINIFTNMKSCRQ